MAPLMMTKGKIHHAKIVGNQRAVFDILKTETKYKIVIYNKLFIYNHK